MRTDRTPIEGHSNFGRGCSDDDRQDPESTTPTCALGLPGVGKRRPQGRNPLDVLITLQRSPRPVVAEPSAYPAPHHPDPHAAPSGAAEDERLSIDPLNLALRYS